MNRRFSLEQTIDSVLLALATFAMCGQIDVRQFGRDTLKEGLGYASKTFALSLSDVLFALLVLWFVVRTTQLRAWKKLWWPPLPCFALIFALLIAALHSPSIGAQMSAAMEAGNKPFTKELKDALADIVQWGGYFLVAPWVLVNLIRDRRDSVDISRVNIVVGALVAAFAVSGALALVQSLLFAKDLPRGLWSSPNIFAAFVAFLLPFLDEIEIKNPRFQFVPLGLSLFAIGILWLCVASPFAAIAAFVGFLCSWAARPNAKKLHIARLTVVCFVALGTALTWTRVPQMKTARAEFLRLGSKEQKVKKQFIEWQVATRFNLPKERAFATGVGPGNYQLNIGQLYQYGLPNEEKMPPDSNNLYLVQAMSIGILGLGALLWVLWHFALLAWRAAKSGSWLGAGVFGSLGAWIFVNSFHAMIVRGAGLVLALFFALAVVAASNATRTDKSKETEL